MPQQQRIYPSAPRPLPDTFEQRAMSDAVRDLCRIRLDGTEKLIFWTSGDDQPDRIVLDDDGFVRTSPFELAAREATWAGQEPLSPQGPSVYDLEVIEVWCKSSDAIRDCLALLNAWNLFGDLRIGESLFRRADARMTGSYDKLFFGCNLPAMTPPGEHYVPSWTASETAALKQLLLLGLAELRARLR
jgi:hypothetical protein